ncbi:MAG: tyrosine--tRNA ligase [Acholeplasmatales bacterium]|jgi:tyrosyl-tRNA synthetase|nr:tyrosine--tRNA ligase [Acholeplasmatales bacterium]
MTCYEDLVYRGLIKDVSNLEVLVKALNEEKFKFYIGYDPSGESLTVGHLVQLVRSKILASYGHTPVVVIGGGTGLIGDPRQTSERKLLTLEQSLANAKHIEKQIKAILPKAIFVNNYDWLKNIDMISFLRDYGKHYQINYMLDKEVVKSRLASGISYTEFSYMIIQAIDFYQLYTNYGVRCQTGGSDQWGNLTSGLDLIKKNLPDSNAFAFSSPLLLKSDGTKFGKSESGALFLDANLTSAFELYQYFLNASDKDCANYLKFLTLLSKDEIEKILALHLSAPEERYAQKQIASQVVNLVHGEKELLKAQHITNCLFSWEFDALDENEFQQLAKTFGSKKINSLNILDLLVNFELATSKREAREFIASGAIYLGSKKISTSDYAVTKEDAYFEKYLLIRRGKKKFFLGSL